MNAPPAIFLSRAERHFYLLRAAFAVGAPWGSAAVFADAMHWLSGLGVDSTPVAAAALRSLASGGASAPRRPALAHGGVLASRARHERLSAILSAPVLQDWLALASPGQVLTCARADVSEVMLAAAGASGYGVEGRTAVGPWREPATLARARPGVSARLELRALAAPECPPTASTMTANPPADGAAWAEVCRYFDRAKVPSDDTTRLRGAGAGIVERD